MFLKNRNIISKSKRSKVTDYAALNDLSLALSEMDSLTNLSGSAYVTDDTKRNRQISEL